MLELGEHSASLHGALADVIEEAETDLVFLAGDEMKALAERLPPGIHVEYRQHVEELEPLLLEAVGPGDAVVIKSSNGVGFSRLVDALVKRYPAAVERSARA
jgi:UDP-N-acetylmuramoyl-tripeptide--D-alanyl-D-alanine ligase